MQALTFAVKDKTFAAPIEFIKELIEAPELTFVPMMSHFLRGVMNLRGSVIPVIDLAQRFGLPGTKISDRTCVVIFEIPSSEGYDILGAMVDAVHEVVDIENDQIDPPPQFGTHVPPDFLQSMIRHKQDIMLLLDLKQVLSIDQLEALVE